MMDITIREATLVDLPKVAELFDLYRQFYEQKPDIEHAYQFITDRFNNHESVILLADDKEAGLVGFCQLYPTFCSVEAAAIYSLYDLYVLPVARTHGVGKALLLAAEAKAIAEGKVRMDLTTAKTNLPAQSLYESLGWLRDDIFYAYNKYPKNTHQDEK
ncbi:MAG TPA: GNAT family N-acetyltransferase [Cellvibrio sp.]|nr:GNAT family N-acetyltransferase [Cellvibrio sp.]